ncbi:hypothetical protein F4780DRAFT_708495 [Xylariomycetidae sp. FL0641]|nr:hypothetical protein F4780DRAFT_708495 [Xylariomycetidae sp. FL0641]
MGSGTSDGYDENVFNASQRRCKARRQRDLAQRANGECRPGFFPFSLCATWQSPSGRVWLVWLSTGRGAEPASPTAVALEVPGPVSRQASQVLPGLPSASLFKPTSLRSPKAAELTRLSSCALETPDHRTTALITSCKFSKPIRPQKPMWPLSAFASQPQLRYNSPSVRPPFADTTVSGKPSYRFNLTPAQPSRTIISHTPTTPTNLIHTTTSIRIASAPNSLPYRIHHPSSHPTATPTSLSLISTTSDTPEHTYQPVDW